MEDREQQVENNSFFVSEIGRLSDFALKESLACQYLKVHSWEFQGQKRRFAEVFYNSLAEAEQAYNQLFPLTIDGTFLQPLLKRAMTTIWIGGLPSVLYAKDLFGNLQEILSGLLRIEIPSHPE